MLDFLMIATRATKRGTVEIYPKFIIKKSSDLMIRGGDFYAVWVEERGLWSSDEHDVLAMIDRELDKAAEERKKTIDAVVSVLHMWDSENGMIDHWHRFVQKHLRDSFHMLDEKLIFSNQTVTKSDYATKTLPYPLEHGSIESYDKLISTLYDEDERRKIEWAIGAIVSGDSKKIQKFLVLYGEAGTGKSTILNIIQQLFDGYYSVFDAKALGSSSNSFALEAFKTNPLVAIQHDGDLSHIEDNTRLNSLVSHELMTVNEKFKSAYANSFKAFLFMGTNKPVKITDARSGLIRRLIDVKPSGHKVSPSEYKLLTKNVSFELGSIASHCQDVYLANQDYYDNYKPINMMTESNDFFNFMLDQYFELKKADEITLKVAWERYQTYCKDAGVAFPLSKRVLGSEMTNYFTSFKERGKLKNGTDAVNIYSGFRTDRFEENKKGEVKASTLPVLVFDKKTSVFDDMGGDYPAQYANDEGKPRMPWDECTTKLCELDTTRLHYVRMPEEHIVIDFDIRDENGNKSFAKNLEAANKWPATYAEVSKSGQGIHLHYIYKGDVTKLSPTYDENIEVKVFTGKSSLRRQLTKCNGLPVAVISSGLPFKPRKEAKMLDFSKLNDEQHLRNKILQGLNKEVWPNTAPSIDYIAKTLDDAYNSGMHYDVNDMFNAVLSFAMKSHNQAQSCMKKVSKMKFCSKDVTDETNKVEALDDRLVFYDVEVFPNLFLVNYKFEGDPNVVRLINPTADDISILCKKKLIGFNCRRYDNHILYGRILGLDNAGLYDLSKRLVSNEDKNSDHSVFYPKAYGLSYTDVYDFAATKQSLKKWEIELGIHHQELGLPWDQPVDEDLWDKVAEYCDNDVIATEAVFHHLHADFVARQVLADVAGMTVNDTTNQLTTKIIFGTDKNPQAQFNYRDLGAEPPKNACIPGTDIPVPYFPGYEFKYDKVITHDKKTDKDVEKFIPMSTYWGEEVGEGGYVYAEPGVHKNVALLDIASMHPSSIIDEELFGPVYTKRFQEIKDARVFIKHKDFESAKKMLNGALAKYLDDENKAKELAQALKIAINSVYGLTSAKFDNPFKDPRNKDNIVAKRGALFMVKLKHAVQDKGYTVAHIKTDSIKIPDADVNIINFVMDFGYEHGYVFEHEATYEKMCLVNDSTYIAKYSSDKGINGSHAGEWTATGTQFQVPYVFKTLFSHEPLEFSDFCETKSVKTAIYLDMNEKLPEGEHNYKFVGKVGQFCPIKPGYSGGLLVRDQDGKMNAVTGSKGFRWLESEMVQFHSAGMECIDRSYYDGLVADAIESIAQYDNVDWFCE